MTDRFDKRLDITNILSFEHYATVFCDIPRFKAVRNYIQTGESIATKDFKLNFKGYGETNWKIIFYPKGQYDFGMPSDDLRAYVMSVSCETVTVRMIIQVFVTVKSMESDNGNTLSSSPSETRFYRDDQVRNWGGPYIMKFPRADIEAAEFVSIKCLFRLLEDDINKFKRGLSDEDSSMSDDPPMSSSKKPRSMPSTSAAAKKDHSPMEVDDEFVSPTNRSKSKSSMEIDDKTANPPDPFTTRSPLLFNRLTRPPSGDHAEKLVAQFKKPSPRTIIFTPEERDNLKASSARRKLSLSRSNNMNNQNVQSNQFKSSGCVNVSDIVRSEKPDEQRAQSGSEENCESSTSDPNMV